MPLPIAIQLYTVRDPLGTDFEGTLKKVVQIGYKNVELAGLYDRKPADVKKFLDGLGLKVVASHVGLDGTEDDVKRHAEQARVFGYQYIVTSGFPGFEWGKPPTAAGWAAGVNTLAKVAEWSTKNGITFCYHNHSFEFDKLDNGKRAMDMLFDDARPPLNAELDVYWVTHGHDDPVAWMKKLTGRVPLLHIKDMNTKPDRGFAEVGTGKVDIKGVIANAQKVGAKYFIVEQDSNWINNDPIESAKVSFNNLTRMVAAAPV